MKNQEQLSRRSFLKGALAVAALIPAGSLLSACAAAEPTEQAESPADNSAENQPNG